MVGRPLHIRFASGRFYVSDAAADRVAVFDSAWNRVGSIGTRGRGPGELLGVGRLVLRDSSLFVAEALNGRVSEFALDGRFVRTYPSPFAAGAIAASGATAYSAARSASHYAVRLAASTEPSPVLRRRPRGAAGARERWRAVPGHDLIVTDSTGTWVFDQGAGELCRFSGEGDQPFCRGLPPDVRERLAAYRDDRVARIEAHIERRVEAAPLAKDMIRAGCWLAVLLPLPEMPLLLIDANDGTLTRVRLNETAPDWLHGATSFTSDGDSFVLIGPLGIGRLYLGRSPPEQ
jgi:hypothetical protein